MFRYPVHFVHHNLAAWADVCSGEPPHPAEYGVRLRHGNDNWILQTYLELKRRSLGVEIIPQPVPNEICVAHYDDILLKEIPTRSFLVGVRGDRPDIRVSGINVVQNKLALRRPRDFFLPHWSQPGLIPRDNSRGHAITKLGYMGMRFNLRPTYLEPGFLQRLAERGVEIEVREYPFQDYSDIDLVLAVRPGTEYDINLKPATKLQNAWLAGCPALLGPESAYRQYRQSELDYVEVRSPDDALQAIDRLQNDPQLYDAMVANGAERAAGFTHEAIADLWIEFFAGPVTSAYEQWRASRRRFRWLDYAHHKLARYQHLRSI